MLCCTLVFRVGKMKVNKRPIKLLRMKNNQKKTFKNTGIPYEASCSPRPNKIMEITPSSSSRQKIVNKYPNQMKIPKNGGFSDSVTSQQERMSIRKSLLSNKK
jgi:hypothetical protein